MSGEHAVVELVAIIVALLFVAGIVRALTKRVRLPFTVVLVVVGIAIKQAAEHGPAVLQPIAEHAILPDVILFVFLPTIIFESAFNLDARQLRQNLLPVLALAIPGLILSTAIIGLIVWWATPFDLPAALLLGAILSATDPVAVIAMFKNLGVPGRLTILVEGESLFNDATAIVAARILIGVAAGGYLFTPAAAFGSAVSFFTVFLGGVIVGWLAALAFGWVLGRVDSDPFLETSLTTILAYLSFILAEEAFHVSGVMATVAAGLTMGSWGRAKISASVAGYIEHFWEYMSFVANALIFLFVGLRVELSALVQSLPILVWVVVAMLVSRAAVVYGLVPLVGRLPGAEPVGRAYQTVMFWGGLRGAIALAIALSLGDFPHADVFVALVMGAVLFTLLAQALTIEAVVRRLGLDKPPLADQVGRAEGLLAAKSRALDRVSDLQAGGLFSARIADALRDELSTEIKSLRIGLEDLRYREMSPTEERQLIFARAFTAERAIYYRLFTNGHLTERAYRDLCHAVGLEADAVRLGREPPKDPLHFQLDRPFRMGLYGLFDRFLAFTGLPERLRLAHVAREYEESWGRFQGCRCVLDEFDSLVLAESAEAGVVAEVRGRYADWVAAAQRQIDATAEQFPEFVTAMQERLARRLLVHAETEIIEAEAIAGSIPPSVREDMVAELARQLRELRGDDVGELRVDPEELLRKVPIFAATPPEEFAKVAERLRPRTVPTGAVIIAQGDTGDSLFLIARGVVRVSHKKDGDERDLATLFAGDFVGEMALLHGEPRAATCRAVTPCALYELHRGDFDEVRRLCPAIQEALEKADRERRQALDEIEAGARPGGQ